MADNSVLPATGETVHADEYTHSVFGLGKTQLMKITWGPANTGNDVDVATGKPLPVQLRGSDGTDRSNALPVSQSGTWAVTQSGTWTVGGTTNFIDVTLTTTTTIHASGEVMADTQVVTNAMRANDTTGILHSIQVLDEDDQGIAFDILFLSANVSIGTENAAVTVSDANARQILGIVSIAAADYVDLGGSRIATKTNIGLTVKPATGTRDVYVATITRGTPTYPTAGAVKLRLGFLCD